MLFLFGVFGGAAAQPWMAAVSAREGANGGGPVRDDGLFTVSRDGVVTEQCLVRRGGAGGNRGTGPIKPIIGTANGVADGKAVCKITHHEQRGDH